MSKNDNCWEELFRKYNIIDEIKKHGKFVITADQIKVFREPRLMTKFDHKVSLPSTFLNYSLSILPISRGAYVISSFSAYHDFEELQVTPQHVSIPSHLQSITPQYLFSESIALNCANACGILSDFLEDEDIIPTVNGRMRSDVFDFNINTNSGQLPLFVQNSQIEIDAAYEGANFLSIFEAKNYISDDFLIRQLYYPYRTWSSRVSKPVKTVFFVFSNGSFYLYQYQFEDMKNYNSLHLVKHKVYTISQEISLTDITFLLDNTPTEPEPKIAFPQANSMPRIINLLELLTEKPLLKQDITSKYAFDERQTSYYTDAGRYLHLINKTQDEQNNIRYSLSSLGAHIMHMPYKERQLAIVKQIIKHSVFNETLKLHLQFGEMPDSATITRIMESSKIYNVSSHSTYERRASTVSRWIEWILGLIES